ncbi:hypothetical protein [Vibrio parahaemolyticus]|uniref:hypothetical protein n=3 Tax=Vibrio parahaemolyticus TaxID=670 RepID=UPI00046FBF51|nr:hypothetical protein [Vibrio parahaemolyticus]
MSKIVTAINAMISNSEAITSVIQGEMESEYFFIYDRKHSWSMHENSDQKLFLHYYPGGQDIVALSKIPDFAWHEENIKMVTYTSEVLGTKEAKDSMKELYAILEEKAYGMDDILEEIIGTGKF